MHDAGEAVAAIAADAGAVWHVRLVEHHPAGGMEWPVAGGGQIVMQLLDARLVRDRRERIGSARRRFRRVLASSAVHLVELLPLGVVRLHLLVGDRPGRRDTALVLDLAEVLGAQAVERRAVQLGRAADEVVHLRRERLVLLVVPGVLRLVAPVDEDVLGPPVLRLPRQEVPALQQQDSLAGRGEPMHESSTTGAASDHDHLVVAHTWTPNSLRRSPRMILAPASIRARCEKAWGKFPRCRPVLVSTSSANRPRVEATLSSLSIRSRARCCSPMIARPETSQKEQIRKLPSLPESPSSVSPVT